MKGAKSDSMLVFSSWKVPKQLLIPRALTNHALKGCGITDFDGFHLASISTSPNSYYTTRMTTEE